MNKKLKSSLAAATCTLISGAALAADDWVVDGAYLSYVEADNRVAVKKFLTNFSRTLDNGTFSVDLVHDSMSGASPTGGLRSDDSLVTFSSASSSGGFSAGSGGDDGLSEFSDTRFQVGATREQMLNRTWGINYGGVFSTENDYESFGTSVGLKRESADKLTTFNLGFAFTADSIYRSDNADTPVPLANTASGQTLGKGQRNTYDALAGITRVLNRSTVAQMNLTVGVSEGYHSDPYKIISAADNTDRIIANYHDSRPDSRMRTTAYGRIVHELAETEHSVHLSYRYYQDDWGIQSHTADVRYHHTLTPRQYIEPHVRLYHQTAADFYRRKLDVDGSLNALLPEDGVVSSDYRLDETVSVTAGVKYGFDLTKNIDLRLRAEYLQQTFSESEFDTNEAVIVQTSMRYTF